jgi:hypothetical protein
MSQNGKKKWKKSTTWSAKACPSGKWGVGTFLHEKKSDTGHEMQYKNNKIKQKFRLQLAFKTF